MVDVIDACDGSVRRADEVPAVVVGAVLVVVGEVVGVETVDDDFGEPAGVPDVVVLPGEQQDGAAGVLDGRDVPVEVAVVEVGDDGVFVCFDVGDWDAVVRPRGLAARGVPGDAAAGVGDDCADPVAVGGEQECELGPARGTDEADRTVGDLGWSRSQSAASSPYDNGTRSSWSGSAS
jgi:hypothetical protein